MFDRFSEQARTTIVLAKGEACRLGHREISAEHILLALLNDDSTLGLLVDARSVPEMHGEIIARMGQSEEAVRDRDIPLNPDARRVLLYAAAEADILGNELVGNAHLLLGILRLKECYAARLLKEKGLTVKGVRSRFAPTGEQTRAPHRWVAFWRSVIASMRTRRDEEQLLLRRISQLVRQGRDRDALKLLDEFMAQSVDDRGRRITYCAPHAAAIAYGIGDIPLVKKYCEMGLAYEPGSLLSLFLLADSFQLEGEREQARKYATQCYRVAALGKDPLSAGVVAMIKKRFPDVEPLQRGRPGE